MTITPLKDTKLFKPVTLNSGITLQNRLVLPPMGRTRATEDNLPSDLQLEFFDQRSKRPGTLVITEATGISAETIPFPRVLGIWSDKQRASWKKIVDKVHENKSFISVQLFHLGGFRDPNYPGLGPDEDYKKNGGLNKFSVEKLKAIIKEFSDVAEKAINESGFDFVELHAAHGFIFDQFFQTVSNKRTDQYGGSIENRARFFLETVDEVVSRVGIEKVAFRLSPWATMGMMEGHKADPHPVVTYSYVIHQMQKRVNKAKATGKGKGFAYLSLVEPRFNFAFDLEEEDVIDSNNFVKLIWDGFVIKTGNFEKNRDALVEEIEDKDDKTLIAIGRPFTSNPDLHDRLENDLELTPYQREYFYTSTNLGYNTFTRYGEELKFDAEVADKQLPKPLI